ncbi:17225_t:CDS:2, partial [Acaulospora colombiana]
MTLGQGILALTVMDISEKSLSTSPVPSTPPKCKVQKRTAPVAVMKTQMVPKQQQKPLVKLELSPELPPVSMIGETCLKRYEKSIQCKDARYRPIIPSSLGPNRPRDREKFMETYPSQRFSTSAFTRTKRNMSTKLIDSTAANRFTIYQKSRVAAVSQLSHSICDKSRVVMDATPIEDESTIIKKSNFNCEDKETVAKDSNMKLSENRPMVHQQRRRLHNNKPPSLTLQLARRY